MSDKICEVEESYKKDVTTLSKALFTIPEHLEHGAGDRGMLTRFIGTLLTALRLLAPATLLTIFWGHDSYVYKFLKHLNYALKSIIYPISYQREQVLKWLQEVASMNIKSLEVVWKNGWVMCGVVDSVVPGACAGHHGNRVTIEHAQKLIEQYFGVETVFTTKELETNESLSASLEIKLVQYLWRVKEAVSKLTPPVSKPNTTKTPQEKHCYTLDYVAKGLGLHAVQTNKRVSFKIFPTAQQSLEPSDITVLIRGPNDIFGSAIVPPVYSRTHLIRQAYLGLKSKPHYTENILPIPQGASYFRAYGRNDMNKTYYIPKPKQDIEIDVDVRKEHAKISYMVKYDGIYEISIISKGCNLVGSPFRVVSSEGSVEYDNDKLDLEDEEECEILDVKTDRKVVFRIVDFVTEKMLLKDNGELEKISDDDANKILNETFDNLNVDIPTDHSTTSYKSDLVHLVNNVKTFKTVSYKVILLIRVSKTLLEGINNKKQKILSKNKLFVPDVVNSTFYPHNTIDDNKNIESTNPFIANMRYFNISNTTFPRVIENSLNEKSNVVDDETKDNKAVVANDLLNPLLGVHIEERPKTPVLKIITGEINDRPDGVYFEEKNLSESDSPEKHNEFFNPIFKNIIKCNDNLTTPKTIDFLIGAPVNFRPTLKAPTPEPTTHTRNDFKNMLTRLDNENKPKFSSQLVVEPNNDSSGNAYKTENFNFKNDLTKKKGSPDEFHCLNLNYIAEFRDSAYVSIDDNPTEEKHHMAIENVKVNYNERHFQMGPAEKELWNKCTSLGLNEADSIPIEMQSDVVTTCLKEELERKVKIESNEETSYEKILSECIKDTDECMLDFTNFNNVCDSLNTKHMTNRKTHIFSASAKNTDVIKDPNKNEELISEVQCYSEPWSASWSLQNDSQRSQSASDIAINKTSKSFAEKPISKLVYEKKKYWDEKIKKNLEELKLQQDKQRKSHRKISKNDSFGRKKGKYLAKTIMSATENKEENNNEKIEIIKCNSPIPPDLLGEKSESKLVDKRRKFWDEKLVQMIKKDSRSSMPIKKEIISTNIRMAYLPDSLTTDKKIAQETNASLKQTPNDNNKDKIIRRQKINNTNNSTGVPKQSQSIRVQWTYSEIDSKSDSEIITQNKNITDQKTPTKSIKIIDKLQPQDKNEILNNFEEKYPEILQNNINSSNHVTGGNHDIENENRKKSNIANHDDDQMFKAFETCPKRFFGTSRKNIIEKIDSYLRPSETSEKSISANSEEWYANGLVNSKMQLFKKECKFVTHTKKTYSDDIINKEKRRQVLSEMIEKRLSNRSTSSSKSDTSKEHSLNAKKKIKEITTIHTDDTKKGIITIPKQAFTSTIATEQENFPISNNVKQDSLNNKVKEVRISELPVEEIQKINIKRFISIFEANKPEEEIQKLSKAKSTSSIPKMFKAINDFKNKESITHKEHTVFEIEVPDIQNHQIKKSKVSMNVDISESEHMSEKDLTTEVIENIFDARNRFKQAKSFFQSLNNLNEMVKPKLNESELTLVDNEEVSFFKRRMSQSAPTSDTENDLNSLEQWNEKSKTLEKISEKFQVEDLYNDIMGEGKLKRQGSFRGIPNKQAVLATFNSIENVSSSYEIAMKQLKDYAKENSRTQIFSMEYPYLPKTEPSQVRSRDEIKASSLIPRRNLLKKIKGIQRRRSAPDMMKYYEKFSVNL